RRWLEDGKTIKIERAPTAFGPVSMMVQSRLSEREVVADVSLPQREPPRQTLLRLRLPDGWKVESASVAEHTLPVDERDTVDLSALTGTVTIRFRIRKV